MKTICTPEELREHYAPVSGLCREDTKLVLPDSFPAVEADTRIWYLVNDTDTHAMQTVVIHKNECMTDIPSDNEYANAFYVWFKEAVSKESIK